MTYHTTTTLNEIRACSPRHDGWEKLLSHLGKTKADDEPLELLTILESNGLEDAFRCLQVPSLERLSRHVQAWCADQVLYLYEEEHPNENRIREQIKMLRNDNATNEERAAAWDAARAAEEAAAGTATMDALAAAGTATIDATWIAARGAAWVAATRGTTFTAARAAQEKQLRMMIGKTE